MKKTNEQVKATLEIRSNKYRKQPVSRDNMDGSRSKDRNEQTGDTTHNSKQRMSERTGRK